MLRAVQWFEKKASLEQVIRNWVVSYVGNFVGSLVLVKLVAVAGVLATHPAPHATAYAKTSLTFAQVGNNRALDSAAYPTSLDQSFEN